MTFAVTTVAAKDGAGVAITGGLRGGDLSAGSDGTGPHLLGHFLVDGVAGVNRLGIYAEDVASGAGDTGILSFVARLDTPVANAGVGTDGDYTTPIVDNFRKLWVTGSYIEDVAAASDPTGQIIMAVRRDTLSATEVSADGDNIALKATSKGKLHVASELRIGDSAISAGAGATDATTPRVVIASDQLATSQTTAQAMSAGYQLVALPTDAPGFKAEDAASAGGDIGMVIHAKRLDTPANSSGTDGDYEPLQISAGRLWTSGVLTAGEAHVGEVGGNTVVKTITMTADTAIMASADIIADTQQLDAAFRKADGTGVLQSVTVFDPDDNAAFAFDVYIHSTSTSMGSENAAISITDANAAAGIIGVISFAITDAKDLINGRMYHKSNIGLPIYAVSGTDDLYVSVVNGSGTPTFAGGSIPIRLGILRD